MTIFRITFVLARLKKGIEQHECYEKVRDKKYMRKDICGEFQKMNIKQKQLAYELEVTPAFVNQFLKGKRLPSAEHLCFICIRLRIEPSIQRYLFHLLDYEMPNNDGTSEGKEKTIRFYLDHCYDDDTKTLLNCKAELDTKCEGNVHE